MSETDKAIEQIRKYVKGAQNKRTPYDNGTMTGSTTEYIPVHTVIEILDYVKGEKE